MEGVVVYVKLQVIRLWQGQVLMVGSDREGVMCWGLCLVMGEGVMCGGLEVW